MALDPASPRLALAALAVQRLFQVQATHIAGAVLLVWDYLLTLDDELTHFWHGRWTWPRLFFFLNRYVPLVTQVFNVIAFLIPIESEQFCRFWFLGAFIIIGALEVWVSHAILCFRVYGLCGEHKHLLWLLLWLFFVTSVISFVLLAHNIAQFQTTTRALPGKWTCISRNGFLDLWTTWLPALALELTGFLLASSRIIAHIRATRAYTGSASPARILTTLLRDSALYFVLATAAFASNALLQATPNLVAVADGPALALISILGSRMLIHLRQQTSDDGGCATKWDRSTDSEYLESTLVLTGFAKPPGMGGSGFRGEDESFYVGSATSTRQYGIAM